MTPPKYPFLSVFYLCKLSSHAYLNNLLTLSHRAFNFVMVLFIKYKKCILITQRWSFFSINIGLLQPCNYDIYYF